MKTNTSPLRIKTKGKPPLSSAKVYETVGKKKPSSWPKKPYQNQFVTTKKTKSEVSTAVRPWDQAPQDQEETSRFATNNNELNDLKSIHEKLDYLISQINYCNGKVAKLHAGVEARNQIVKLVRNRTESIVKESSRIPVETKSVHKASTGKLLEVSDKYLKDTRNLRNQSTTFKSITHKRIDK